MIRLSLRVAPLISGSIHVMCNPLYSWDTEQVFETGHRRSTAPFRVMSLTTSQVSTNSAASSTRTLTSPGSS